MSVCDGGDPALPQELMLLIAELACSSSSQHELTQLARVSCTFRKLSDRYLYRRLSIGQHPQKIGRLDGLRLHQLWKTFLHRPELFDLVETMAITHEKETIFGEQEASSVPASYRLNVDEAMEMVSYLPKQYCKLHNSLSSFFTDEWEFFVEDGDLNVLQALLLIRTRRLKKLTLRTRPSLRDFLQSLLYGMMVIVPRAGDIRPRPFLPCLESLSIPSHMQQVFSLREIFDFMTHTGPRHVPLSLSFRRLNRSGDASWPRRLEVVVPRPTVEAGLSVANVLCHVPRLPILNVVFLPFHPDVNRSVCWSGYRAYKFDLDHLGEAMQGLASLSQLVLRINPRFCSVEPPLDPATCDEEPTEDLGTSVPLKNLVLPLWMIAGFMQHDRLRYPYRLPLRELGIEIDPPPGFEWLVRVGGGIVESFGARSCQDFSRNRYVGLIRQRHLLLLRDDQKEVESGIVCPEATCNAIRDL